MRTQVFEHEGPELTGAWMHAVAREFSGDLGPLAALPFPAFFDLVRSIPYSDDETLTGEAGREIIPRPSFLLNPAVFPALDCKKKAILMAAWALQNGIPYRFIAAHEDPSETGIHHVFPLLDFGYGWVNVDATYPEFEIGQGKPTLIYGEDLIPWAQVTW